MSDPSNPLPQIIGMSDALVKFREGLTTVPKTEYPVIILVNATQYHAAVQVGQGDVQLGISRLLDWAYLNLVLPKPGGDPTGTPP